MNELARLKSLLSYGTDSGEFRWKHRPREMFKTVNQFKNWNGRYPGRVAGTINTRGYRSIVVHPDRYTAHRLAWLFIFERWPADQLDHINGERDDNRIANLREVTPLENSRNKRAARKNKTGCIGVTLYPWLPDRPFCARIRVAGKLIHLGYFASLEAAVAARGDAEEKHGFRLADTYPKPQGSNRLQGRGFDRGARGAWK